MDVEGPGSVQNLPPKLAHKRLSATVHSESPYRDVAEIRKRKVSHQDESRRKSSFQEEAKKKIDEEENPEKKKFVGFGNSYVKTVESVRSYNAGDPLYQILLTKKRFPVLYLITFSVSLFNIIAISSHKNFGQYYINRDHFLASVGSISALMWGFRGFIGFVVDKEFVGFQRLFVCITASTASCALLLFWCAAADLTPMYLIVMIIVVICDGILFVITQKYVKQFYNKSKRSSTVFYILQSASAVAAVFWIVFCNLTVGNMDKKELYLLAYTIGAGVNILSLASICLL